MPASRSGATAGQPESRSGDRVYARPAWGLQTPRAWNDHQRASPSRSVSDSRVGVRGRTSVPLETFPRSDLDTKPGPVSPKPRLREPGSDPGNSPALQGARPCTEARVPGPEETPTPRRPTRRHPTPRGRKPADRPRGEGPPGARAGPRGQSPPPAPGLCAGCPLAVSPRRPAPGQSSRPRPGPNPGRATFRVSESLRGQGCASLSGGRPRGAYLGAGAADRARAQPPPPAAAGLGSRAQPRSLCSLRGSLRSRPGVTFSLAPNPPPTHPSRPGPRFARPLAARRAGASPPRPPLASSPSRGRRRRRLLFAPLSGCPPAAPTSFPPSSLLQRPSPIAGEKTSPPP